MSTWKDFEINATNYLNKNFGDIAEFIHQGEEDSTTPDILVNTSYRQYFIEAKNCPAQCGQFVLLPNLNSFTFEYSRLNVNEYNEYAQIIMDFMNKSFEDFKEAGTAGKPIVFPGCQKIFANWIIKTYANKGVRFIITNDFKILLLEEFYNAFDITATYRIKRSGSSDAGGRNQDIIIDYIENNYFIKDAFIEGKKIFVTSNIELHDSRFFINSTEYMISKRGTDLYEIRKLSNTFNANVIFSIYLKSNYNGLTLSEFREML